MFSSQSSINWSNKGLSLLKMPSNLISERSPNRTLSPRKRKRKMRKTTRKTMRRIRMTMVVARKSAVPVPGTNVILGKMMARNLMTLN